MGPTRSLILKTLLVSAALAFSILLVVDLATPLDAGCYSSAAAAGFPAARPANSSDLDSAFRYLIANKFLSSGDCSLAVGPDSAAASIRRVGLPPAVIASATACCGLPFQDSSFDFVFAAALVRVRVPARLVLEMERVVRPGGFGVVYRLRSSSVRPNGLMKEAAPVASLLRFSDVVGARAVNGSAMVVFKKRGGGSTGWMSHRGGNTGCYDIMTRLPLFFSGIFEFVRAVLVIEGGWFGKFE